MTQVLQAGIYATEMTRQPKDMRGLSFPVEFEIIDRLLSPEALAAIAKDDSDAAAAATRPNAPYQVRVLLTVRPSTRTLSLKPRSACLICPSLGMQRKGLITKHEHTIHQKSLASPAQPQLLPAPRRCVHAHRHAARFRRVHQKQWAAPASTCGLQSPGPTLALRTPSRLFSACTAQMEHSHATDTHDDVLAVHSQSAPVQQSLTAASWCHA